ncbi:MAG TPA: type II toxin-antitoxin system RelE/ParE family toxin [Spirochaetota bacterium]|nr:type II toxin-antitoxin system RelE/ParE family toxin [Spirochaetota bacterium]
MIKSFAHKGLEDFHKTGSKKGIIPDHSQKLDFILDRLEAATIPKDMNLPGFSLHQLQGKEKETWSVKVNGNWRVTFVFQGEDVIVVDYRDYH